MAQAGIDLEAEELTDEQVEQLLARATARLKANAALKAKSSTDGSDVLKFGQEESYRFPKLQTGELPKSYVSYKNGIAHLDSTRLIPDSVRKQANSVRKVQSPAMLKKSNFEKKQATAGKDWFDLPKTNLTPEFKRDLQLIKMRDVLDPHRHYKKDGGKMKAPEFSQVGTIVEGPTEFFTGRIENKKRKRTFVEEVLAGEQDTGRFKKKYGELQTHKTSGKKAFYQAQKAKRRTHGVKKGGQG